VRDFIEDFSMTSKISQRPEDRREHERVPARIEVRIEERVDAARAFRAFSLNFSNGGICIKTEKAYELGSALQVFIAIGEEEHSLGGTVAWVREGAIGVRFDTRGVNDRESITRIMNAVRVQ
jgi:Tfp pilus assembly protein PilZ